MGGGGGENAKPVRGDDFHRNYFNWCVIIQGFARSDGSSAPEREEA